nr:nuclear RNA polymerase D1B [Tanacetum cinerariifolium]
MGLKADEAGWGSNKSDHTENCSRSKAYSWGQKVVNGNEAEWGAKKARNELRRVGSRFLGTKGDQWE